MREPITSFLMMQEMEKLIVHFPRPRGSAPLDKLAELYRDHLRGMSGDALRWAVREAIQRDSYFPKIARLQEFASRFNILHPDRSAPSEHPLYCRGCKQNAHLEGRWRPKLGLKNRHITDELGRTALEVFTRYQCDCSAPSQWQADSADDPFMSPRTGSVPASPSGDRLALQEASRPAGPQENT